MRPGRSIPTSWTSFGAPLPEARASTTTSSEPTSTPPSILIQKIGTSGQRTLIDTSILAGLKKSDLARLPPNLATSTLAVAELARGPGAAADDLEKARRLTHLGQVEASVEALPFDTRCARAYAPVCRAVEKLGRKPRGSRAIDLLIAATALAHEVPLCTLNSKDLRGLEQLIEIVDVSA